MSEWAKAFVAAQTDMPDITKDKEVTVQTKSGGSFKYRYADLPTIVEKIRPHLAKHGLAVAQNVTTADGRISVETLIYHSDGHFETFGPIVLPAGNDAQAAGSAITYARRYALCAALNIAADDDDDGQQASKNSAGSGAKGSPPKHSGMGATNAAAHSPVKAAADNAAPVPDQSQRRGEPADYAGEANSSTPPAAEDWLQLIETFGASNVLQTAQQKAKDADVKPPFTKKALADMPPEILDAVAADLAQRERVAS